MISFDRALSGVNKYLFSSYQAKRPLRWPPYQEKYLKHIKTMKKALSDLGRYVAPDPILLDSLKNVTNYVTVLEDLNRDLGCLMVSSIGIGGTWVKVREGILRKRSSKFDIFQDRNFSEKDNLCFVVMPFRKAFKKVYEESIKVAARHAGVLCKRADDIFDTRGIVQDIWEHINRAAVIVADITDENANVFYEVGLSHALGKRVILITQGDPEKGPFDVRHIRCISYANTDIGRSKLQKQLSRMIYRLLRI